MSIHRLLAKIGSGRVQSVRPLDPQQSRELPSGPVDKGWGQGARGRLDPRDREILRLAIPAFGALIAEPLFLLGDAAVVARLGTQALAGVAIAGTILGTVVGLCIFLAYGTTGAVARRLGAGDRLGAVRDGVAGLWLGAAVGLALLLGLSLAAHPLSVAVGASSSTIDYAVTYLQISALGLPAMLIVLAGTGVRRGLQDTKTPLLVAVTAAIANLAMAAVFVLILDFGVAGSAWATVIAQTGSALVYLVLIHRDSRRTSTDLRPRLADIRRAARTGGPLFVRTIALRAVFVLSVAVAARLGDVEVAAYQLAFLTWILLAMALDALAIAGQAIVGRSLGAGDVGATRHAVHRMIQWGIWAGVVLALVVLLLRPLFDTVFGLEPEVTSALAAALLLVAVHQPIAGPVFVLDGVLIGAGDGRWLAGAQLVMLAAYAPLALAVPVFFEGTQGLVALWVALLWFMLVRLALLTYRERAGAWMITGAVRG